MTIPKLDPGHAGKIGILLLFPAIASSLLMFDAEFWVGGVAMALLPWFLFWVDRGSFGDRTLGETAKVVAALNFGRLAEEGGRVTTVGAWAAYLSVLRDEIGFPADAPVGRKTRFIQIGHVRSVLEAMNRR